MRRLLQTRGPDALSAAAAERQHGVVARAQLLEWGLRPSAIDRRLRLGRLHRLYPGVYSVGHTGISRDGRWTAAVLFCGPGAALSHRSAAALWGIRSPGSGAIEVTISSKSRSRRQIRRHCAALAGDEVTTERGVPTTTVPRTLFDLATVLNASALGRAIREAERLRLYDALSLEDLLIRHPGRHGAGALRACLARELEMPAGITREELEARFAAFLEREHLPRPRLNAWLILDERRFQVDCLWTTARLIVELDGYATHGTRSAFESDRERDRLLRVAGWTVVRITWRQLRDDGPAIAMDLRRLLA